MHPHTLNIDTHISRLSQDTSFVLAIKIKNFRIVTRPQSRSNSFGIPISLFASSLVNELKTENSKIKTKTTAKWYIVDRLHDFTLCVCFFSLSCAVQTFCLDFDRMDFSEVMYCMHIHIHSIEVFFSRGRHRRRRRRRCRLYNITSAKSTRAHHTMSSERKRRFDALNVKVNSVKNKIENYRSFGKYSMIFFLSFYHCRSVHKFFHPSIHFFFSFISPAHTHIYIHTNVALHLSALSIELISLCATCHFFFSFLCKLNLALSHRFCWWFNKKHKLETGISLKQTKKNDVIKGRLDCSQGQAEVENKQCLCRMQLLKHTLKRHSLMWHFAMLFSFAMLERRFGKHTENAMEWNGFCGIFPSYSPYCMSSNQPFVLQSMYCPNRILL